MITISLCMIVKNEEHTLARCLDSIGDIPDEIIIIDTGSTDNTKKIAATYTNHIFDFQWVNDFSQARNYSFQQATKEYILWLDADDMLQPEERNKLLQLKQTLQPSVDAVSMLYHVAFDEHQNVTASTRRIRLVKRSKSFQWVGIVHEDLMLHTTHSHLASPIIVTHASEKKMGSRRNLEIYEKALQHNQTFRTHDMFHYAQELTAHGAYEKAIPFYETCKTAKEISLENRVFVYHQLATCYAMMNEIEKEEDITLQSFQLDVPQPVFCCRMGESFIRKEQYEQAIFWYTIAMEMKSLSRYEWSIQQDIYRTWLPHKQLAFCYYQLGEYEKSYYHNQNVLTYLPDDPATKTNVAFLQTVQTKE
ncbi:glycosyl transferase [Bacillus toyonensis]|uniref:glycosyltransferase n=2 Tax=Bacillus toyonensis TaxID=155322 RepID=UPI000BEFD12D|nr:glycosyltransferase family 2 protein [Bacillus toyonensis]PEK78074.1 glycosyl transferase [Bacillus toyonensis]PFY35820.1 glycosyl transferase [Bacillus toyonensis]PHA38399.1 glycosyl transferase [Bacillus toyonensis]PHD48734.1 glycosyl transferase [Bacillus toyonensis]